MDAQGLSTIHDLVNEDGRDIVYQEARLSSNLVDVQLPSEEQYRPKPAKQRTTRPVTVRNMPRDVGTVQVKKGGLQSFGMTADGAARRAGGAVQFNKGRYEAKILEGELEIPIGVAQVANGGNGIDFVDEQLRTMGSQFGTYLDRAVIGTQLSAPDSTVSTTSYVVADPSGFVEGEQYDHYSSGDVYQQTIRVLNIAPPSTLTGSWTLTLESTPAISIPNTAKIYQSGGGVSTQRLVSLADVNASGTSLYSLSTTNFPSGLSMALSAWDNISGRRMGDLIAVQSGSRPTHIITNSIGASKIINASTALRRFTSGEMDPYGGAVPKFDDLMIVICEQASASTINWINADKCFVHQFWGFQFQSDGVGQGGFGASVLRVSENNVSYKGFGTFGGEFVCNHRRAFGQFTGVGDG